MHKAAGILAGHPSPASRWSSSISILTLLLLAAPQHLPDRLCILRCLGVTELCCLLEERQRLTYLSMTGEQPAHIRVGSRVCWFELDGLPVVGQGLAVLL